MPAISEAVQRKLEGLFTRELDNDVTITYFTEDASIDQECTYCQETLQLLQTVTALSDKLHLTVKDFVRDEQEAQQMGITRIPAFVIQGQTKGKVRFFGIPSGYDFSVLIDGVIDVSKGRSRLTEDTRNALAQVDQDLHIQVFVTPSCPYCPKAGSLAHQLAIESQYITADVIEASEFGDLVQHYHIKGVPRIIINDQIDFFGALPEPQFVEQVLKALDPNAST